ncbi:MAG: Vmc-like lipoprotein signal peptide domain-containing protein [Ruminiclostridium sp.]
MQGFSFLSVVFFSAPACAVSSSCHNYPKI